MVRGTPMGAPLGACVHMTPKHKGTEPQKGTSPVTLMIDNVNKVDKPKIGLVLKGKTFQGKRE